MSPKPGAPQDVKVTHTIDKLRVGWKAAPVTDNLTVTEYQIVAKYYAIDLAEGEPIGEVTATVNGGVFVKELQHLDVVRYGDELKACTVKVTVVSLFGHTEGGSTTSTTSWLDAMKAGSPLVTEDLSKNMEGLKKEFKEFQRQKGKRSATFLVVGMQHHGKSSLINSYKRCAFGDLGAADEVHPSPPNQAEGTVAMKTVSWDFKGCKVFFRDSPAFTNVVDDNREGFDSLLAGGVPDLTRRNELAKAASKFRNAEDGAILVVSIQQWIAQQREVEQNLQRMTSRFQVAAGGKVTFPYVVAVTKIDEFLGDCQCSDPHGELVKHVKAIREATNTDHVFPVVNYKAESMWSSQVNNQAFLMLRALVARAKHEDTNVAVSAARAPLRYAVAALVAALSIVATIAANSG